MSVSTLRTPPHPSPPFLFFEQKKTSIHSSIFRATGLNMSLSRCVRLDGNTPAASCWLKAPPSPIGRLSELERNKNHRRYRCVRFVVPHLYARPKISLGDIMRLNSCAELSSPYSSVRSTATSDRPHSSDRGSERESLNRLHSFFQPRYAFHQRHQTRLVASVHTVAPGIT